MGADERPHDAVFQCGIRSIILNTDIIIFKIERSPPSCVTSFLFGDFRVFGAEFEVTNMDFCVYW